MSLRLGLVFAGILVAVAFPATARATAPLLDERAPDAEGDKRERAALLDLHVGDELFRDEHLPPLPGVVLSWVGTAGGVFLIPADKGLGITWTSTFAITAVANTAAAFGDEDAQVEEQQAIGFLPMGGMALGLAFADRQTLMPRLAPGGAGAGLVGFSALSALNMLLWRHAPIARLRADRARLRTPEQRAALSPAEVAQIERDFLTFERPIPGWALALPLLVGGSVSLIPAFERSSSAGDRGWSVCYGSVAFLLGIGIAVGAEYSPPNAYISDLQRVGLHLTPLASRDALGVSVSGEF
jgi:hypothetical protein